MTARMWVRSAIARCRTQAGGNNVQSDVAVCSEMASRPFAECMAVTSPLHGETSADSTAGPVHSFPCCDVDCQTKLLPYSIDFYSRTEARFMLEVAVCSTPARNFKNTWSMSTGCSFWCTIAISVACNNGDSDVKICAPAVPSYLKDQYYKSNCSSCSMSFVFFPFYIESTNKRVLH